MAKRRPGQIELLFVLDEAAKEWQGETGYASYEMLAKHLPPAGLADKTKVSVQTSSKLGTEQLLMYVVSRSSSVVLQAKSPLWLVLRTA